MSHPELDQELLPDRRAEVSPERVTGMLRLILAEADHPLGFTEIVRAARQRQDFRLYRRSSAQQLDGIIRQERLLGHAKLLAFRNRVRLTPKGLTELERTNQFYHRRCETVAEELVDAAAEWAPDERPSVNHTRIELDQAFGGGLTVSWVNHRRGLISLAGSDLMESECSQLPERYRSHGTLYLVERRLGFGDLERGHVEETLVFDYPGKDEEAGRQRYAGLEVPDMRTEIHRDRVPLGLLRQLTAELKGFDPATLR